VSEYVTLLGTEQIGNAARSISESVRIMQLAANQLDETMRTVSLRVEEWLQRAEALAERLAEKPQP
jgi:Sec-independent protein translocase protein TatA